MTDGHSIGAYFNSSAGHLAAPWATGLRSGVGDLQDGLQLLALCWQ